MVAELKADEFKVEVLESSSPVLVDFYATYCEPCKRLLPIVEELSKEYEGKVKIVKFNVENSPEIAGQYGIMGVPALLFFKGGEVVDRLIGFQSKPALKEALDRLLN
ncbi:MAG: thioredoxin [Planctomycetota bacterium]|nr:MAG: thioredoxin [Planctomycetota bacterium]